MRILSTNVLRQFACTLLLFGLTAEAGWAADQQAEARQAWQLLDYIAVDYAGAVRAGQVIEPGEYQEMQEFAATVHSKVAGLPATSEQAALVTAAERLQAAIAARAEPDVIAQGAHALAAQLLAVYRIEAAPTTPPDVSRVAPLYEQQCAGCHGASGRGDGPLAARLTPRPIAFTDARRADE